MRDLLDSRGEKTQGFGLRPSDACLPEHVDDGGEYCGVGSATAALHCLEGVQGVAPLPALLVRADEIRVRDRVGHAIVLRHALEHETRLVVLPAVGTGRYHAIEDADIWLTALHC